MKPILVGELNPQLGARPVMDGDPWPHRSSPFHPLKHPKGGDPSEWPEDLRVREFPS